MKKIKLTLLIILSITSIISIANITKPKEYKTKEQINTIDKLKPLKETIKEDIVLIETTDNKPEVSKPSQPEFYAEENYIYIETKNENKKEFIEETTTLDINYQNQEEQIEDIEPNPITPIEPETTEEKLEPEETTPPTEEVITEPLIEESKKLESNIYIIENKINNLKIQENETNISLEQVPNDIIQKWNIISLDNDEYKIISTINSNKVLQQDLEENIITTNEYQELDSQKWFIKNNKDGYNIISKENNLCLDTEDTLQLKECIEDNDYQIFYFKEISVEPEQKIYKDGNYIIKSSIDNNKVLDIENRINITLTNISNSKSQIWNITNIDNKYYKITSATNNNMSLTLDNNKNIILEKWQNKDNQKWNIVTNIDNTISIISLADVNISLTNNIIILEEYTKDLIYYGIDISVYQGDINWQEVANSNVEFVIIRAGFGDNWTQQDDQKLINNVKGCEEHNIPYGVYLYSYAINLEGSSNIGDNSISVTSEIAHTLRLLNELKSYGYTPNLGTSVFYDMEDESTVYLGKERLTSMANKFCEHIEKNGYTCGIYANKYWLTNNLDAKSLEQNYTIWLAEWPNEVNTYEEAINKLPTYNLTDYKYWQFTSIGTIPGITGNVDLNLGYNIFK